MALSSYATTSLEDVIAQGTGNPYMMQMCIVKDRNITMQLLKRAEGKLLECVQFIESDADSLQELAIERFSFQLMYPFLVAA